MKLSSLVASCLIGVGTVPGPLSAQTPVPLAPGNAASSPAAPRLAEYTSVAQALAELSARDGAGTIVVHSDGWTIINELGAQAQWSFTPTGHRAHPAVVRRTVRRDGKSQVNVETASLCEGSQPACDMLLKEFEAMNDRITQSIRARARQGSTPP